MPPTVEKVILARLDRLSAAGRDLVTAASALGRTFALPLLEGVLGEDGPAATRSTSCSGSACCGRAGAGRSRSTASATR